MTYTLLGVIGNTMGTFRFKCQNIGFCWNQMSSFEVWESYSAVQFCNILDF